MNVKDVMNKLNKVEFKRKEDNTTFLQLHLNDTQLKDYINAITKGNSREFLNNSEVDYYIEITNVKENKKEIL